MMSISIPVSAASVDTEVTPYEKAGISTIISAKEFDSIVPTSVITEDVYLPRANAGGTNGNPCGEFTANVSNVSFNITYATGGTQTYNVQLYKGTIANGGTMKANYETLTIGSGFTRSNLKIGSTYFFKVSSYDCHTSGANATYTLKTYN